MGLIYLFFPPGMLPSEIPQLPTDCRWEGFLMFGNFSFMIAPPAPQEGSPSLTLLSLFLSFIFCPTSFRKQWAAFLGAWCPLPAFRSCFVVFPQCLNDLSMNLWGRKWVSLSYSSATLTLPPLAIFNLHLCFLNIQHCAFFKREFYGDLIHIPYNPSF